MAIPERFYPSIGVTVCKIKSFCALDRSLWCLIFVFYFIIRFIFSFKNVTLHFLLIKTPVAQSIDLMSKLALRERFYLCKGVTISKIKSFCAWDRSLWCLIFDLYFIVRFIFWFENVTIHFLLITTSATQEYRSKLEWNFLRKSLQHSYLKNDILWIRFRPWI